jgi:diguanylate cyclase (GGDEF)-like protein
MEKVLVVEDTQFFASIIRQRLESELNLDVTCVYSMAEAVKYAENTDDDYLALLDLTLPDSLDGEVVNYFTERKVPSIVFTGSYDEKMRDKILQLGAIDYVLKDSPASFDYLLDVVSRVVKNTDLTALVVDNSSASRHYIGDILRRFQLNVIEACNGKEALKIIREKGDDIRLVITDYHMPYLDGIDLIKGIRKDFTKGKMAILGLSSSDKKGMSAHFIKAGANDFIHKPFEIEEFLVRIQQNLDYLDYTENLRNAATKDFLTGLYNRRYFYETAPKLIKGTYRRSGECVVVMLDIDKFKIVNDTHGHDAGDKVLKVLAKTLNDHCRDSDLLARLGGEEFGILMTDTQASKLKPRLEKILQSIQSCKIDIGGKFINVTISLGATVSKDKDIEELLNKADDLLYQAKEGGRNRGVTQFDSHTNQEVILCPQDSDDD